MGTIAIETSELLSKMLTKKGIPHKVLNAKFHELEAEIVADAGIHGSVLPLPPTWLAVVRILSWTRKPRHWAVLRSSVRSAMSPAVSTTSCADVPDVRETRVSPGSTCPWRTTFWLFGSDRLMKMFEAMGCA